MSWFLMNEKGRREKKLKELKKYFARADKDHDDEISRQDWYDALTTSGVSVTREDVDRMFKEHDKDLDGKLTWNEFIGEETANEKAFKIFDQNKDGKISKAEFKKFATHLTNEQVTAAFAKFDISGDNKLDYKEFCLMMNSSEERKRLAREKEENKGATK